ncbi:MAG: hypothetical protein Aurels2KO_31740 [Aureliella sp.]
MRTRSRKPSQALRLSRIAAKLAIAAGILTPASSLSAQPFQQPTALGNASVLQDVQTSPSDRNPVVRDSIELNLSDTPNRPIQESTRNTPPAAAQLQLRPPIEPVIPSARPRPQAAVLGSRQPFGALGSSAMYRSPLIGLTSLAAASPTAASSYFRSAAHRKLSRMPEMFGDFRRPGPAINFDYATPTAATGFEENDRQRPQDFPTSVAFSGLRISENNIALPQDRIWLGYNHFHGAFQQPGGDLSLDRFVFGLEKTFFSGNSSVEVRLPVSAGIEPNGALNSNTAYAGGSFGNLSLLLKHVLFANDDCVIAAGLGIETPTGSQTHALDTTFGPVSITHDPSAVYLAPFIGTQKQFGDNWFANGFIQVDVPTYGDELIVQVGANPQQTFFINQPTLLQIDLGVGAWLWAPSDSDPTGLALISELHIATALQEADDFEAIPGGATPNVFVNTGDSIGTLVNLTNGFQASLRNGWSVRCGISVPLLVERIFDTEALVQLNRSF